MKWNIILKTVITAVIMVFMAMGQSFGQTLGDQSITPSQALASIAAAGTELIYPPGYIEWLQSLGNTTNTISQVLAIEASFASPTPVSKAKSLSTSRSIGSPMGSGMSQDDLAPTQYYALVDLGTLGGSTSEANGINNQGHVVGYASLSGNNASHAFLYANGSMQDLGTFGGTGSAANAINNNDQVVGFANFPSDNIRHAFLYSGGALQDLGTTGFEPISVAYGINDSGQIVGDASGISSTVAFLYSNGSMQDLDNVLGGQGSSVAFGINNSGQVTGRAISTTNHNGYGFLYVDGVVQDIGTLGQYPSVGLGINANGKIVGNSITTNNLQHAFLYSDGIMQDLGTFGGTYSQANAINSSGQVVGVAATTAVGDNAHAFSYANGSIQDLNNLIINTNAGWILKSATAINDGGQIVGYGTIGGHTHAFLLNPLPLGAKEMIETQPSIKVYGNLPVKGANKDSLVVVAHGWIPKELNPISPPDQTWVDDMSNAIVANLANNVITNWQVHGYKWINNAYTLSPDDALNNGIQEGIYLGNSIVGQGWTNVHFIAHSAGAGLIESATETIRKYRGNSIVIQCTFLDPYDGKHFTGTTTYGSAANWSDRYIAQGDIENQFSSYTSVPLEYSYNVDVTGLDPVGASSGWFIGVNGLPECNVNGSTHGWPVTFYQNTITGNVTSSYLGFGFPLGQEGGGWSVATNNYTPGNGFSSGSVRTLGVPYSTCSASLGIMSPTPVAQINPSVIPIAWQSTTGTLILSGGGLTQKTGSPAWVGFIASYTNAVNVVDFDADFTSASGAAGLLTLYWNADVIGTVDERTVGVGWQHYSLPFPVAAANSSSVLGFRLDPFTNIQSTVTVTNIVLSQVGVTQPFFLGVTTNTTADGLPLYQLTGQSGFDYGVQASSDLVNWTQIAVLENTNGAVTFFDADSTNFANRFYRAIAPY